MQPVAETMAVSDAEKAGQAAVAAWLESGAAFDGVAPTTIVTHGNVLYLTGARVYKMKRVLDLGWMDFSSLALREAACRRELSFNRRTAPEIYLDVLPVTRGAAGGFALGGGGEAVEWLVVMRRFAEERRLDHLLARSALEDAAFLTLADDVARFHAEAAIRPDGGGRAFLTQVARDNDGDMARAARLFDGKKRATLLRRSLAEIEAHSDLIAARAAGGWVRHCHGDLHLANIVLWKGRPTPFDCIEFNETFARIDVLYDLAFLLMDLERSGRRDLGNLVLNRWLAMVPETADQVSALALLPLFQSLRAGVRAKIAGLHWLEAEGDGQAGPAKEAQAYLDLAEAYLRPAPPRLLAVGGLSGSGKSSLAKALAPAFGAAPGALHLRSDVVRKRLFGVLPEDRLPDEAYRGPWHRRVAQCLLDLAGRALSAGRSVVLDAVHAEAATRAPLADLARRQGVPFQGLWLDAPPGLLRARVAARRGDASDATPDVVAAQVPRAEPPLDWLHLDASGSREAVLRAAKRALDR